MKGITERKGKNKVNDEDMKKMFPHLISLSFPSTVNEECN
jgi:hypothetical protein